MVHQMKSAIVSPTVDSIDSEHNSGAIALVFEEQT